MNIVHSDAAFGTLNSVVPVLAALAPFVARKELTQDEAVEIAFGLVAAAVAVIDKVEL